MSRLDYLAACLAALLAALVGIIISSIVIAFIAGGSILAFEDFDMFGLITQSDSTPNLLPVAFRNGYIFTGALALIAGSGVLLVRLRRSKNAYGDAHFQTQQELRKNGLLIAPKKLGDNQGLIVAKNGKSNSNKDYIVADAQRFPHLFLVAPTGGGKGVGPIISNLLHFQGSAIVLDPKGENFKKTSRYRKEVLGQTIYRFAPLDFEKPSHSYNPLQRIAKIKNPDQQQIELGLLAELFLTTSDPKVENFLTHGRRIFVSCAMLAIEEGNPTMRRAYELCNGEGEGKIGLRKIAERTNLSTVSMVLKEITATSDATYASYISTLTGNGMRLFGEEQICKVTDKANFDPALFRKEASTLYIDVPFDSIEQLAPLIRLLYSETISSFQKQEFAELEAPRHEVLMLLDEFQSLGKMPVVLKSLDTVRAFGVRMLIVAQQIPKLDMIYGEDGRNSIMGAAGMSVYYTPNDLETAGVMSSLAGKKTHLNVTRNYQMHNNPLVAMNRSAREEGLELLKKDDAMRLDPSQCIIYPRGMHPIQSPRLKYFEDPVLKERFTQQDAYELTYPFPSQAETAAELEALKQQVNEMAGQGGFVTSGNDNRLQELEESMARVSAALQAVQSSLQGSSNISPETSLDTLGDKDNASIQKAIEESQSNTKKFATRAKRPKPSRPVLAGDQNEKASESVQ